MFLIVGTSIDADQHQLVGAIERRQHRPVEERRRVDDHDVVALLGHREQVAESLLGDQLGVLGPKRGRQHVHTGLVRGDVAGQCIGIELAASHDQVVDGLVRLDAHHDGGVAELEVEVEQQRPPLVLAGEHRCQVAGKHGLARLRPWARTGVTTLPSTLAEDLPAAARQRDRRPASTPS